MSRLAEKNALKIIREKHERKYGAPLGKRCCKAHLVADCLKVAAEYDKNGDKQWVGHVCRPCRLQRYKNWYRENAGAEEPKRRGRPPLSASEKKKREKLKSKAKSQTKKK